MLKDVNVEPTAHISKSSCILQFFLIAWFRLLSPHFFVDKKLYHQQNSENYDTKNPNTWNKYSTNLTRQFMVTDHTM